VITIRHTADTTSAVYRDALAIRKDVFIKEQHVSETEEIMAEDSCTHFVLYDEGRPLATCRLLPKSDAIYKVQRVAVLKAARGKRYGEKIMLAAEDFARAAGATELVLGAQTTALGFYCTLGYEAYGNEYLDANIPHYDMKKKLR